MTDLHQLKTESLDAITQISTVAEVQALQDHLNQYDDPQKVLFDALGISRREHIDVEQLAIALKESQSDEERSSCRTNWLMSQGARFGHEIEIP